MSACVCGHIHVEILLQELPHGFLGAFVGVAKHSNVLRSGYVKIAIEDC